MHLSCDFETSSSADIKLGAYHYLTHDSTRIIMMAWRCNGQGDVKLWWPGNPFPDEIRWSLAQGAEIRGWNVQFEALCWNLLCVPQFGFPFVEWHRFKDSIIRAVSANMPRALERAGSFVGAVVQKDTEGSKLMKELTNQKKTPFEELWKPHYHQRLIRLGSYCCTDVATEEAIVERTPEPPTVYPWRDMPRIDQDINLRGVMCDRALVRGMREAAAKETTRMDASMKSITNGRVATVSKIEDFKNWLLDFGVKLPKIADLNKASPEDDVPEEEGDAEKLAEEAKQSYRLRKNDVVDLLAGNLPGDVTDADGNILTAGLPRLALQMRQDAAKISVKKLDAMDRAAAADDRLRGALIYMGAQQTGRFCLAAGTPVLIRLAGGGTFQTPIEKLKKTDRVWDGESWVAHDGVVFSGEKSVIVHDGVEATVDHDVFISDTEKLPLGEVCDRGLRIWRGNRSPLLGVPPHFSVWKNLHRANGDDTVAPMVCACDCGESFKEREPSSLQRDTKIRKRGNKTGYSENKSDRARGDRDREGVHSVVEAGVQPYKGRRDTQRGSIKARVGHAPLGPGCLCCVPGETERRYENCAAQTFTRVACRINALAQREPGSPEGDCASCLSGKCEKISGETAPSSYVTCRGRAQRMVRADSRTAQESDICCDQAASRGENTKAKSGACSADKSCACSSGPCFPQAARARGDSGILGCTTRACKTYDVINAGPKNRFAVVTPDGTLRIVSNSGAVWQPHNFPRRTLPDPDDVEKLAEAYIGGKIEKGNKYHKEVVHYFADKALAEMIEAGRSGDNDFIREKYGAVLEFVSRMLRRTLCAPAGHVLLQGDFAQIEARITAWLAGQLDVIQAFAEGKDVYKQAAAPMVGKTMDALSKEDRQLGKVGVLGLGFGGGAGVFVVMSMGYGIRISREKAKPIVYAWRDANSEICKLWYATKNAYMAAMMYPGRWFEVAPLGLIAYMYDGYCLYCRLPSGRFLRYWSPRFEGKDDFGNLVLSVLSIKGRAVIRRRTWHGLFVENYVQAIAVDLLCGALEMMDRYRFQTVLHVHDSIAAEVPEDRADELLKLFRDLMLVSPNWTKGLPTNVDCHYAARFG